MKKRGHSNVFTKKYSSHLNREAAIGRYIFGLPIKVKLGLLKKLDYRKTENRKFIFETVLQKFVNKYA